MLNSNANHEVVRFFKLFKSRAFDQRDVSSFIREIRDFLPKKSILREFGDFLAHPQCKDRGASVLMAENNIETFERMLTGEISEDEARNRLKDIGGLGALVDSVQQVLAGAGIEDVIVGFDEPSFRDFVFCLVFLLDSYSMKIKSPLINSEYSFSMRVQYDSGVALNMMMESASRKHNFISCNLLYLPNVSPERTLGLNQHAIDASGMIARRFKQGFIAAIERDEDLRFEVCDEDCFKKAGLRYIPLKSEDRKV